MLSGSDANFERREPLGSRSHVYTNPRGRDGGNARTLTCVPASAQEADRYAEVLEWVIEPCMEVAVALGVKEYRRDQLEPRSQARAHRAGDDGEPGVRCLRSCREDEGQRHMDGAPRGALSDAS